MRYAVVDLIYIVAMVGAVLLKLVSTWAAIPFFVPMAILMFCRGMRTARLRWRKMRTAPTDGTQIVGLVDGNAVEILWVDRRL